MRTSLKQYIDSLLTQNYKLRNMHIPFHKEEMNKYHGKDSGKYDYALQWFNRQEKELEANKMIIKEYDLLTAKAKTFDEIKKANAEYQFPDDVGLEVHSIIRKYESGAD